jgi:thymidine kinase
MSNLPSELKINNNISSDGLINKKYGEITLILGCMFAGKSSELIRQIRRYRSIGLNVFIIKHIIDDRYNVNSITSHDKESIESVNVSELETIWSKYMNEYLKANLIVIEEAQFFESIYDFVIQTAEKYGKDVIVAGLDGNFKRKPFLKGELLDLVPIAENVYKLHGFCQICHKKASFTKSVMKDTDNEVVVGGKECYIPVCRQHYIED